MERKMRAATATTVTGKKAGEKKLGCRTGQKGDKNI